MNYFSHGRHFIDDPYVLAGTAVPDWLSVADRRVRVRARQAAPFVEAADASVAAVARGIARHHYDDGWFHGTDAFADLSWQLTAACRAALPDDDGFRPSFLGHILVELLLDAALIKTDPAQLERYYAAMESAVPQVVQQAVNQMAAQPTENLAWFIERFCQVRFLWDYAEDGKLLFRLNQVLGRVQLAPLPESFVEVIAPARQLISARAADLLPAGADHSQTISDQRQRTNPPCNTA